MAENIEKKKRKYFVCEGFGYIVCHCRNKRDIEKNRRTEIGRPEYQSLSNKFKVSTSNMIQIEIASKKEEKKEKLLREVTVKIGSKQEDNKDGITVKILLNIGMT